MYLSGLKGVLWVLGLEWDRGYLDIGIVRIGNVGDVLGLVGLSGVGVGVGVGWESEKGGNRGVFWGWDFVI